MKTKFYGYRFIRIIISIGFLIVSIMFFAFKPSTLELVFGISCLTLSFCVTGYSLGVRTIREKILGYALNDKTIISPKSCNALKGEIVLVFEGTKLVRIILLNPSFQSMNKESAEKFKDLLQEKENPNYVIIGDEFPHKIE